MKERILEIIPDRNDIERTLKLAEEYGAVFEYNDFMIPPQTEDADKRRETVAFYRSLGRDLSQDTLHGAFLDITVHSQDPWIRRVSGKRIYQSMETAEELGVRGVVFHTGLLRDYREKSYLENWLETNAASGKRFWKISPDGKSIWKICLRRTGNVWRDWAGGWRLLGVSGSVWITRMRPLSGTRKNWPDGWSRRLRISGTCISMTTI